MSEQIKLLSQRQAWGLAVRALVGLILVFAVVTAILPWQTHNADEVAVVIAAPVVGLLVSLYVLVYIIDTALLITLARFDRMGIPKKEGDVWKVTLEVGVRAPTEGLIQAAPFLIMTAAASVSVALYLATGITWAVPTMELITVLYAVASLGSFVYGWYRGVLDRRAARQTSAEKFFVRARMIVRFLRNLGMAGGV